MKKFIAQLRDGSYINIPADTMEVEREDWLTVYADKRLVAIVDVDCLVSAHLSGEKEFSK